MINQPKIYLPDIVGGAYKDFWNFKGRYRVVKGSRASKKSKTMALWLIFHIMKHPEANALVIRKTFRTLKNSCFTELKWAIKRLGVSEHWKITESPLELTYTTGQKIYFTGLDDSLKITSITVETGFLCWLWIEEAYEIMQENDFNMIDESIRGEVSEGLFKQLTLTFNPWNDKHWIKSRFFDCESHSDVYATTTTYLMNEWLDDADRKLYEEMRVKNPRRYQVAGLGNWGIVDGVIYENWREEAFNVDEIRRAAGVKSVFGLDFGYTNDPTALFCGLINLKEKQLWIFDEMYEYGLSNKRIFEKIKIMGYAKERIIADSAEPKSIDELDSLGLWNIRKARKGKDSVAHGIQFLQDFEVIIHTKCVNFITEISNYTWDEDKFGKKINKPIDNFNHLMDAMRYSIESYARSGSFSFD